ncbi:MAG TPA: acetyl-CoA hydrolase/transferase C-terminal domain-containing protein [Dokdonella sp.]|uniref:acetyl-CoA hydrolase/transferase C-terminal domain-containing protein n=1 Tax=Dokdonella sp. TaxID=2291710 RepID=UPI002CED5560|nr:acetyl-CoA hydrolase/transferase C-terminal domain-containing protein [Dokdonella sp.]HOX70731.1 acetyl-CoA hydrolase/transferase C-terminal domain-containing protein [Dokdonella sp.]
MQRITQLGSIDACVDRILDACGQAVVLAAPLGLGKPNRLINAVYRRIAADPARRLTIHTALSLDPPKPGGDLERRFADPFLLRQFGSDYPALDYVAAMQADALPGNIRVHEFYFQSGTMLRSRQAQRDYASLNYSVVARDLVDAGVNVIVQLVARRGQGEQARYSLGCNPDVTLDLIDRTREAGMPLPFVVGVVNEDMPFLGGDADVGDGGQLFDVILDVPAQPQRLFAVPREDVDDVEYAIGLHASTLVRDGGTLQIGIGALSDALVEALLLRQKQNNDYVAILDALRNGAGAPTVAARIGGLGSFEHGLYGSSEMVMDGFMHLRRAGILKRKVHDDLKLQQALDRGVIGQVLVAGDAQRLRDCGVLPRRLDAEAVARLVRLGILPDSTRFGDDLLPSTDGGSVGLDLDDAVILARLDDAIRGRALRGGRYLQGGFCLGSSELYTWLAQLDGEDHEGLAMCRISEVNLLQRGAEELAAVQRRDARFFNTCMIATALGAAVSDAVDDGRVVSGVGGQYNFVAMAHALEDARSILMLRATRREHGVLASNIRWNYAHATIPRHLRDIYVTEYGVADLRGKTDEQCVIAMLAITDAAFQGSLVDEAIRARKLPAGFIVPGDWSRNTRSALKARLEPYRKRGLLPDFPFGSDFDAVERRLLPALTWLKTASSSARHWPRLAAAVIAPGIVDREALARMGLDRPQSVRERILARLVSGALNRAR